MTLPRAFLNYAQDSACPYHRLLCPARFTGPAFKQYGWDLEVGEGLPPGYEVYFFHGLPNEAAIVELAKIKRRGCKFVWSLDDDWLSIPEWNPAKPSETGLAMYEIAASLADFVLTSTPALAKTFKHRFDPGQVLCAPNLTDLARFPDYEYEEAPDGSRNYKFSFDLPVKVVWVGGPTHKEDLTQMGDAVARLIDKEGPEKVAVIFQGMAPPAPLLTKYLHRGLYHQPSVTFTNYQKILLSIRPDVYLAPLAPVEFNLCKSNLRVMEGWSLMACPVASQWGEYSCIESGRDGRYADNPDSWFNTLHRLVNDHEYRLGLAANGRQRVEREYDWNNPTCLTPWYSAFARIFDTPVPV